MENKEIYNTLKNWLKENNQTSFDNHELNLVYYAFKHNIKDVEAFFLEQSNHCEKKLINHGFRISIYIRLNNDKLLYKFVRLCVGTGNYYPSEPQKINFAKDLTILYKYIKDALNEVEE